MILQPPTLAGAVLAAIAFPLDRRAEPPSGGPDHAPLRLVEVAGLAQTEPVDSPGDAADDPAIWRHPTRPEHSLIIATDKRRGLVVYDLEGRIVRRIDDGRLNNVDLRTNVRFSNGSLDLLAASDRDRRAVRFYTIDARGALSPAGLAPLPDDFGEPMGLALARPAPAGQVLVFVANEKGDLATLRVEPDPDSSRAAVRAPLVDRRRFESEVEGMVVDDERGVLFAAEEAVGIWRLSADPAAGTPPVLVDRVGAGRLVADVEGLTIHRPGDGRAYLIASSQGDSTFAVYDLHDGPRYLFSFRITAPAGAPPEIDPVEDTDGIDAAPPLGPRFPRGLLVVQDGVRPEGRRQNFKLVRWDDIESAGQSTASAPASPAAP